jgi:outer membrane protein insertion porin family
VGHPIFLNIQKSAIVRWVIGVCILLATALAFVAPALGQATNFAFEGRRVNDIRIMDEHGAILPDKLPAMALEIGKPFDMEDERASLRTLYATGRYSQIRVEVALVGKELRVDFVVVRNLYNNVIRIEGLKEPPTEASALAAVQMPLGEPFRENALNDGISRLNETLKQEGLYRARVERTLEPHEATQQMDASIQIFPGPRARIGAINIVNKSSYKDEAILKRLRFKANSKQDVTSARISHGSDRLRKKLVSDGYLGATVEVRRGDYDPATNHLPLTIAVTAGPRVRVQINGAHYRPGKLRNLLPIYAEGAVDEDLLQEGLRNIRDDLQREGFFDSDVTFTNVEDPARNERLITYTVTRDTRHKLIGVTFSGNHYFSSPLLASRLQLQPTTFLTRGKFSQRMVRDDADSIRGLYYENGFTQADAKPVVTDVEKGKFGEIKIHFDITEGPQTRVADVKIEGNVALSDKQLTDAIGSSAGQPYSEVNVASDRNNILALYYNDGFPDVRIDVQATPAAEPHRMNLVYRISEGTRVDVLRVLLTGYEHTRYGIIDRQVEVKPGGPLREGDVVDTQRKLYNLAIFNRVQIAPQNPAGTDPDKTVVVAVEEGKRYTFGYGFGFEVQELPGSGSNPTGTTLNASPRVILELGKANLFGRAQSLSFKVRASTLQYRGVLTYTAPNFLTNPHLNFQITGYADKTQDVNTFNSERYEGAIQFVQNVSPSTTMIYRYFFRHVLVDAASLKISPEEIPLFSQPTRISGVGASWIRDRRNNAADATKGTFNTVDASIAEKAFGSSASFFRGYFQNSTFTPFGRSFVFARAFRFGVEQTLPGTTPDEIPLPERYFAGGGQSIRGFGLNQAGPRDPVTGFPVGGLALLEFNQEIRFPMKLPFVGSRLGGTVLYDAGNVYSDIHHITFRAAPVSPTDLEYFSHTIGAGLRYATPIGPVRVDFGYQLNPAKFQFINSTTNLPEVDQLPHFQFFFNIGPVF